MLHTYLKQIGLSYQESKIYLFLLEFGTQPASVISTNTKINRTTVYQIINNLISKGILNFTQKQNVNYFTASKPEELINYLESEKNDNLYKYECGKATIPLLLNKLQNVQKNKCSYPKIRMYQGEKGLKQAYLQTLNSQSPLLAYSNFDSMHQGLPGFFPEYYNLRVKAQIKAYCICPDTPQARERTVRDSIELRESILVPEKYFNFSPELVIFNNSVLIISWKEKLATIIESQEISNLQRQIFHFSWNHAKIITHQLPTFEAFFKT